MKEPPRSFPISWYCKLDTGIHYPKVYPELQMQQNVASGLAAQTCQFDRPCTNLAWCSFPDEPQVPKDSSKQPPTRIYKTAAKEMKDQDPRTTHLVGNLATS